MLYVASNCEFNEEFFKYAGKYIGDELMPYYQANDWAVFCTKIYKSGICTGLQAFFDDVTKINTLQELTSNYMVMKEFVCVQRALIPLYYAFETWPVNPYFNAIMIPEGEGLYSQISDMIVDLSGFNLWVVSHGADSGTLRANTSLKQLKQIERTEKKKGAGVFLAMGFRAVCCYKSLLQKFFWPQFITMRPEVKETFKNNAFATLRR